MDDPIQTAPTGRVWPLAPLLGAIVGFTLGLLLALANVSTSVPFDGDGPSFNVRILGVVVYRYPEDGDFLGSKGRPYPQWLEARQMTVLASGVVCCVVGWAIGFACSRLVRGSRSPGHVVW